MKFFSAPIILLAAIPISFGFLPSPDTSAAPGTQVNRIFVFRATPFEVRPGGSITIDGSGFSRTLNKVYFNGISSVTATSSNGTTLMLNVPTNLSVGEYKISVVNVLGTSANAKIPVVIKVTNTPQQGPTIISASVSGDMVTLVGEGFTSLNTIITTLGNSSKTLPANGKTLTFPVTDLAFYSRVKQSFLGRKYQVALWIYVQNEHGINKDPYRLDIII